MQLCCSWKEERRLGVSIILGTQPDRLTPRWGVGLLFFWGADVFLVFFYLFLNKFFFSLNETTISLSLQWNQHQASAGWASIRVTQSMLILDLFLEILPEYDVYVTTVPAGFTTF